MALNKTTLKTQLKQLATDMLDRQDEEVDTTEEWADRLSTIIDSYIRTQTITVSGVVTAGNQATQTQTAPVQATIN